jgi:hypothetical protein
MARQGIATSLDEPTSGMAEDDRLADEFAGSLAGIGSRFPAASGRLRIGGFLAHE